MAFITTVQSYKEMGKTLVCLLGATPLPKHTGLSASKRFQKFQSSHITCVGPTGPASPPPIYPEKTGGDFPINQKLQTDFAVS